MIDNIEIDDLAYDSTEFQKTVLSAIKEFVEHLDFSNLHDSSACEKKKALISIALVHKKDLDSMVIMNLGRDYLNLWVSECHLFFDESSDIDYIKDVYVNCLGGNYETTDYYIRNKLIFSITNFKEFEKLKFIIPRTIFYFFYKTFYRGSYNLKKIKYRSFL